jgi:hypothetical protein
MIGAGHPYLCLRPLSEHTPSLSIPFQADATTRLALSVANRATCLPSARGTKKACIPKGEGAIGAGRRTTLPPGAPPGMEERKGRRRRMVKGKGRGGRKGKTKLQSKRRSTVASILQSLRHDM